MTRKKLADVPATGDTLERPTGGGSFVRQADGSLERVEFTDHAGIGTPIEDDDIPADDGGSGQNPPVEEEA